jgi:hypothetical protein
MTMLDSYKYLASSLAPDIITPEQYLDMSAPPVQPEARLMMAVLMDAISCLNKYCAGSTPAGRRLFDDAYDWIMKSDTTWPFSFESITNFLKIDSDYLRSGIEKQYGQFVGKEHHHAPTYRRQLTIKREGFAITATVLRATPAGYTCKVRENEIYIPTTIITKDPAMPNIGETGEIVVSWRFARWKELIPNLPPRLETRRYGGRRGPEKIKWGEI